MRSCWLVSGKLFKFADGTGSRPHQPSLECDGVDVEVYDQAQVMVHMFQTAQHLEGQRNISVMSVYSDRQRYKEIRFFFLFSLTYSLDEM